MVATPTKTARKKFFAGPSDQTAGGKDRRKNGRTEHDRTAQKRLEKNFPGNKPSDGVGGRRKQARTPAGPGTHTGSIETRRRDHGL